MDGGAGVLAMQRAGAEFVCTVRVARGSDGSPRDLLISRVEVRVADRGHVAALVGRPWADILPGPAEDLLRRIGAAEGASLKRCDDCDLPGPVRSLTPSPSGEKDQWRVSLEFAPDTPAEDARLREPNHRVLNSLAMLSSIIGVEARALDDEAGRAALERVRSRLVAVSSLYRILSAAESGKVIRADVYLRSVADAVAASVGFGERFAVEVDAAPSELTTSQAASLGLITNEALTNAYKHAFVGREKGRIRVVLSEANDERLIVTDDGTGLRGEAGSGLGTTLIEALAADLSGGVMVESGDWGTSVRVRFPDAC